MLRAKVDNMEMLAAATSESKTTENKPKTVLERGNAH